MNVPLQFDTTTLLLLGGIGIVTLYAYCKPAAPDYAPRGSQSRVSPSRSKGESGIYTISHPFAIPDIQMNTLQRMS